MIFKNHSKVVLSLVFALATFSMVTLAINQKASAVAPAPCSLPGNSFFGNTPAGGIKGYVSWYDAQPFDPNQYLDDSWLSTQADPGNDSIITVPYGTQQIPMQINKLIFVHHSLADWPPDGPSFNCSLGPPGNTTPVPQDSWPNGAAHDNLINRTYIKDLHPSSGSILGSPVGQTMTLSYAGNVNHPYLRYWFTAAGFIYDNGSPLTHTKTITIMYKYVPINEFKNDGVGYCVAPDRHGKFKQAGSPQPPSDCPVTPHPFQITINVIPKPEIKGLVYYYDGQHSIGLGGVALDTCKPSSGVGGVKTAGVGAGGANGGYSFKVDTGKGFCIRVPSTYKDPITGKKYVHPVITPNHILDKNLFNPSLTTVTGTCPGFGGTVYTYGHNSPSYEGQLARPAPPDGPGSANGCDYNLPYNEFYNIAYEDCSAAPAPPGCPVTPTPPHCSINGPADIEDSSNFSLTANIYNSTGTVDLKDTTNTATWTFASHSGRLSYGTIPAGTDKTGMTIGSFSLPMGTYTATLKISGFSPAVTCSSTIAVYRLPYLSVQGGDVVVGRDYVNNGCSPKNSAAIYSWNLGASSGFAGAGTDDAAFALGQIDGFATDQNGSPPADSPPSNLSFANTLTSGTGENAPNNGKSGDFGGGFSSTSNGVQCIPDYWGSNYDASNPSTTSTDLTTSDGNFNAPSGTYTPPALLITGGSKIVFVKGDLYINNDIKYTPSGGGWPIDGLPSITFIVHGNIYIDASVHEIDGSYIAQNDPTSGGGNINTCAVSPGVPVSTTDTTFYNKCNHNNQLLVRGGLVAQKIDFDRVYGTRKDSTASNTGNAAEYINFGPWVWLAGQSINITPPSGAYSNLPPIL